MNCKDCRYSRLVGIAKWDNEKEHELRRECWVVKDTMIPRLVEDDDICDKYEERNYEQGRTDSTR